MRNTKMQKLTLAAVLCAVAVAGSLFSFPMLGSRCAPVQHMVNVLCAVLLGPAFGTCAAFIASLLRNMMGLGSLMAFPGSMFGALLSALAWKLTKNLPLTLAGEVAGTSVLGGLCAYPVAVLLMGRAAGEIAFYAYMIPFLISTAVGSAAAGILIYAFKRNGVLAALTRGR